MIKRFKQNEIKEIVKILNNDGVVSVPTDTVYGICARIDSKVAYNKLRHGKNRELDKSFPIMCVDEEQIRSIALIDNLSEKIIRLLMPGSITVILKKKNDLPEYITNGKETVAIRMATSEMLKELIINLDIPIFMTSANRSGNVECSSLDEIEKECDFLDGMVEGDVNYSMGSTIVDCTSNKLKILREGPISKVQIEKVLS